MSAHHDYVIFDMCVGLNRPLPDPLGCIRRPYFGPWHQRTSCSYRKATIDTLMDTYILHQGYSHGMYILLCLATILSEYTCDGYPAVNAFLSGNQTWLQAVRDRNCVLVGLNLTGDIRVNKINITIEWGTTHMAWIGAHREHAWIHFHGCYFGKLLGGNTGVDVSGGPVESCLLHCNYGEFVLTQRRCFCVEHVNITESGCKVRKCPGSNYPYCGNGEYRQTSDTTLPCMCRYSQAKYSTSVPGKGNCMAVIYTNRTHHVHAVNCSSTHQAICFNPSKYLNCTLSGKLTWSGAMLNCYNRNKQFAGIDDILHTWGHGTFWIGAFKVFYTPWGGDIQSVNDSRCIAAQNKHKKLSIVSKSCHAVLPALCIERHNALDSTKQSTTEEHYQISTSTFVTSTSRLPDATSQHGNDTLSTLPITTSTFSQTSDGSATTTDNMASTVPGTMNTSTESKPRSLMKSDSNTPVSALVVVSVVGGVLVLLLLGTFIFVRRRRAIQSKQTSRSQREDGEGDKMQMTNEPKNYISAKEGTTAEGVYNTLSEPRTDESGALDDMYDHARAVTGVSGDTYGHLNGGIHQSVDNEYDHVFVGGSYGHLSDGNQNNGNEYDHTYVGDVHGYGHFCDGNQNYGNEYDHTCVGGTVRPSIDNLLAGNITKT